MKNNGQEKVIEYIKTVIKDDWGLNPDDIKDPEKDIWYFKQGKADCHIQLFTLNKGNSTDPSFAIEFGGIVLDIQPLIDKVNDTKVAEKLSQLKNQILELNSSSVGKYFAIRNKRVILLATRELFEVDSIDKVRAIGNDMRYFAAYWKQIFTHKYSIEDNDSVGSSS